jgi:DNA-binding IclR family transcriptional regulator
VLLAVRPEERQTMIAEHLRSNEKLTSRRNSSAGSIRCERGYEMMASAQTAGVYNLSAPILSPDGRAIASLTFITVINMPSAPDITRTIEMLTEAAAKLSQMSAGPARKTPNDLRHTSAPDRPIRVALSPGWREPVL